MEEWVDGWTDEWMCKTTGKIVLLSPPRSYQGGTSPAGFSPEVTCNTHQIFKPVMKLVA